MKRTFPLIVLAFCAWLLGASAQPQQAPDGAHRQPLVRQPACSTPSNTGFCEQPAIQQTIFDFLPGVTPRRLNSRPLNSNKHIAGAFWQTGRGYTSTLILRNKDSEHSVSATVAIFGHDGNELAKSKLEVAPNVVERLRVNDLLGTKSANLSEWGNLMLEFTTPNPRTIGQVVIENYSRGLIFDLNLTGGYRYDTDSALYAPFWLADEGTDGTITLTNASNSQTMAVSPSIRSAGQEIGVPALSLSPHETKKLSIRELLRQIAVDKTEGTVVLRYTGSPHSLFPSLMLANATTGFSLVSDFNALHAKPGIQQTTWWFPDVFIAPDGRLGFNTKNKLTAFALLSNGTQSPLTPSITANITDNNDHVRSVTLPTNPLAPMETRLVNLSVPLQGRPVSEETTHVALNVTHNGSPGDLGITVFSVGETKDFVFRSEGTVHPSQALDSSYWDISDDLVSILHLQNTSSVNADVRATLTFQPSIGVASYGLPIIHLPANGSEILNLNEAILSRQPDEDGHVVPIGTTFGTLKVEVLNKDSQALIFGGSTTLDPAKGGYGFGIFPDCSICTECEECLINFSGGECIPSCDSIECCAPPPDPPAATFFQATGADAQLSPFVCELGSLGLGFRVHYQLLDQNGSILQQGGATPLETVVVNGATTVVQAPFSTPRQTNGDGTFDDFPLVTCFQLPFPPGVTNPCISESQTFDLDPGSGPVLPIATNSLSRQCAKGIALQVIGNPVPVSFSAGTVN